MTEIKFKKLKKKHDSGYSCIDKKGDLEYCQDAMSKDGIWLYTNTGERIIIDCDYDTGFFSIKFNGNYFRKST